MKTDEFETRKTGHFPPPGRGQFVPPFVFTDEELCLGTAEAASLASKGSQAVSATTARLAGMSQYKT